MLILLAFAVTIALHLLLGWEWTLLGGVLCGWLLPERSWLGGMMAVGGAWAAHVFFDWVAAPESVGRMVSDVGQIMGNLDGPLIVVLTVSIGCLLGLLGGLIGGQLKHIVSKQPKKRRY